MTRIVGHMVVHNELDRYLRKTLPALCEICDVVVVVDDQSTDDTVEFLWDLVNKYGLWFTVRPDPIPSFAEDESAFREFGWWQMNSYVAPSSDDLILCLDADEFLVAAPGLAGLEPALLREYASLPFDTAVRFPVAEIFEVQGDRCYMRKDGYWGSITADRLVRWGDRHSWDARIEGGGSIPSVPNRTISTDLTIMHFGYAEQADRISKYERYSAGKGHSSRHVQSILKRPVLELWPGVNPLGG